MKRSEINRYIREAIQFFESNHFYLPVWARWSTAEWQSKGEECDEIRQNGLGWDITDFGKGRFAEEGLTLVTIRNGNLKYDNKPYCEKIMLVREKQITPIHFHWKKWKISSTEAAENSASVYGKPTFRKKGQMKTALSKSTE